MDEGCSTVYKLLALSISFRLESYLNKLSDHASTGDITNWMDPTSGAFNYTGLVENMETKAGMFYGMCHKTATLVLVMKEI